MTSNRVNCLSNLHTLLANQFNLEEIRTLCLYLYVDYESIPGTGEQAIIWELLLGLGRNGRLPDLIAIAGQLRPDVDWPSLPDDFVLPESLVGETAVSTNQYHIYGDIVQGDKFTGDKIAGNKIETETYIVRQVIVQGVEITDLEQLPPEPGEPPYKGLSYFTTADHEWFFGREKSTATLVNRLHDLNFLAVVGDSGSGKSSLVQAGVIPVMTRDKSLADGTVPPMGDWRIKTITPTTHPLTKLATTLFPNNHAQQAILQAGTAQNSLALHHALGAERIPGHKLLLFVDQFEELFTLCTNEEERQAFINNLLTVAEKSDDKKIIITLRADFYAHCLRYDGLRQMLKTNQEPLGAMSNQELAAAILEPAAKGKWQFQAGLVKELLDDLGEEPGRLPLLSHALLETWERRRGRVLTLSGYQEAGKIQGAIAQTAEAVYKKLSNDEQKIAQGVFLRLTALGTGTQVTRRRVSQTELGDNPTVKAVTKMLTDARLITISEADVDVSHEALIREWPRLRGWLDTDRNGLLIHRDLTNAAKKWDEAEQDDSYLHAGLRLYTAEKWAKENGSEMNTLEQTFLTASLDMDKHRRQNKQALLIGVTFITCMLIMLMFGAFFLYEKSNAAVTARNEAITAQEAANTAKATSDVNAILAATSEAEARTAESDLLSLKNGVQASQLTLASQAMMERDPELALLLAITGLGISNQTDTQASFYDAVYTPYRHTLGNIIFSAVFDSDGGKILTTSFGKIQVWDIRGNEILSFDGHTMSITSAVFNADGDRILTASSDGTAKLWDMQGNEIVSLEGHKDWVNSAVFNTDENMILTASNDGMAKVWDVQGNELASLKGHTDKVELAVFNFDGDKILTVSSDDTAKVWDTQGNELASLKGHTLGINSAVFNSNGDRILTASNDGTAKIWDINGNEIASLIGHTGSVDSAIFNISGDRILTVSNDGTARIWDINGNEIASLDGHTDKINSAIFNPGGDKILTASWDGTVKIWDIRGNEIASLNGVNTTIDKITGVNNPITNVIGVKTAVFNANEDKILTVGFDGMAKLWDIRNETVSFEGHTSSVSSAVFNVSGNRILTASSDNTAKLWDAQGNEIITLEGHIDKVNSAVFNTNGDRILTASDDGTAKLWDIQGNEIITIEGHTDKVNSAVFNANGDRILTASNDGTAKLWDMQGNEIIAIKGHTDRVISAVFNVNANRILTASWDNTVKVWDVQGNEIVSLEGMYWLYSAVFNAGGDRILTAGLDSIAKLWDVQGNGVSFFQGHTEIVFSAIFNSDGDRVLTASGDGTAKIWDIQGNEIASLDTDAIVSAVFNPGEDMILTANWDGTAKLWRIYPTMQSKVEVAQERLSRGFTNAECDLFFSDDRDNCPQTVEAVFALFEDDLAAP